MKNGARAGPDEEGSTEPLLDQPQEFELDEMAKTDENEDDLEIHASHDSHSARNSGSQENMLLPTRGSGTLKEDQLTVLQLIKMYPAAIFWSVMVSMCVIMEGFDLTLIGNFMAYPSFQKKYGTYYPGIGQWQVSAPWQAALANAAGIGSFFGSFLCGYLAQNFGKKKAMLYSLVALSAFVTITFTAPNKAALFIGELLCGLPWGVFATISPAYASEVLPHRLRVYLTSYTNMCFVIGQLLASGVLAGLVHVDSQWGYRIPFALQWIWPAFLVPLLLWAPESPYHLVQNNEYDRARAALKRLVRKSAKIDTEATLQNIIHTNKIEMEISAGTSFADCLKGVERRRTIIACVMFAGQCLAGSTFAYNSTYFFEQVGMEKQVTYNLNLGGMFLALAGCVASWFLVIPYFGRRTIYLWGLVTLAVILLVIGALSVKGEVRAIGTTQAALTLVWTLVFQLSVGQLGWAIPAEIGSTRLRQKTVCLARNAYYIISVTSQVIEPYCMNPTQWNLKGYTGFIWFGTASMTAIWGYFYFPETKGRPEVEVDLMFNAKVPARKFKNYQVNAARLEAAEQNSKAAGEVV